MNFCQHANDDGTDRCTNEGQPCYLPDKDEPDGWYCFEHAQQHGFCYTCGNFYGGINSFDFGNGLCEHCEAEIDEDDFEED